MGKATRNEQIKLRAIYHNNIASGLYLAGCILPLFALYPRMYNFVEGTFAALRGDLPPLADVFTVVFSGLTICVGLTGAHYFRGAADAILESLED